MFTKSIFNFGGAALFAFASPISLQAQEQWSWPEKPENLQVLPNDWSGSRLRPVMLGFTRSLGVRCSYCHKGKEGDPLSMYEFASDENPNKNRAREMLRMLGSINDHLKKIEPSGDKRVNMWCHTCHAARPRPMTLEEELGETYRLKGLDSVFVRYTLLKKRYFGRGAYDFGENALNSFGYELLQSDDTPGAIKVFTLNTKEFPESANAWDSLAEAYMSAGNTSEAEKLYRKSLELDPQNENARTMLGKLKESGEPKK